MNKLDMAHDYAKIILERMLAGDTDTLSYNEIASDAYQLADAMQAEADKREPKGFPEVLQPEVDWRLAPSWAEYHAFRSGSDMALWCINMPTVTEDCILSNGACGPAPSFGFTDSHVVERPQ